MVPSEIREPKGKFASAKSWSFMYPVPFGIILTMVPPESVPPPEVMPYKKEPS